MKEHNVHPIVPKVEPDRGKHSPIVALRFYEKKDKDSLAAAARDKNLSMSELARKYVMYCLRQEGYIT